MVALGWVSLQREVWHRDAGDTWSPQGRGRKPPPSLRTSRGNMAPPTPRFHLQNCGRINFRCLQPPCLRRSVMAAPGTPGCVLLSLHVTRLLPLPCKVRRCDWPRCWGGEGAGLRRGMDLAPGDGVVTLEAVDGKANGREERARRAKGPHLQSSCWNFGEGA